MDTRKNEMGSGGKAFTLIELLIVVAIIAILAMIAVPNFLEAQMRSKVSRVYTDMRSVAVAIEAYRTDNENYPPMLTPQPVTTPIPYISTLPIDPFFTDDTRQTRARRTFEYVLAGVDSPNNWRNDTFYRDYYAFFWPYLEVNPRVGSVPNWLGKPEAVWQLKSWGPDRLDRSCPAGRGDDFSRIYDPTNGTVSHGDLCRFGP